MKPDRDVPPGRPASESGHNERVLSFYESRYGSKTELPSSIHFGYSDPKSPYSTDDEAMSRMDSVLASEAGISRSDTVLDAGCGFGGSSVWLASEYGCRVVGLNLVPDQLLTAEYLARESGVSHRTDFIAGDFTDTGLAPESFDVVFAIESVCHTPDKAAFLKESARLLKPGGRLVVADFFLTERDLSRRERLAVDRFTSGWSIPDLPKPSWLLDSARSCGLNRATVRDISDAVLPSSRGMYREAIRRSYPKNLLWWRLGLRPYEEFANARSSLLQYTTLRRRLWSYGILSAVKKAA